MLDFMTIATRSPKRGEVEIYPKFIIKKSKDLMIRGQDFYAIWDEERKLWSTDEEDVVRLIDQEIKTYYEENRDRFTDLAKPMYMWDADTGMIDKFHKYCQKQSRDSFHMLDEKLIFSNDAARKEDYASKRLPYPLEAGDYSSWDKLLSTLYSEEERRKIEWAIGSIITGDSKTIQKFVVLYGAAGTGKSTVLNIIQMLFDGYYSVFDSKALGSATNVFALEAFRSNPLVAIEHDGDLSRIEDNTKINSLVSHEQMTVNEKFKSTYTNSFKCFLIMGTNKPVRITDGKSGLLRRLIDVSPSGDKLSQKEYKEAMAKVKFELGAIAWHCKEVYLENPGRYDDYVPVAMLGASNDFYNFILSAYHVFKKHDSTTLKEAWEMYKLYCDDAKVPYPYSQRSFKEELKNYFREYSDRIALDDGARVRSYYTGFRTDIFEREEPTEKTEVAETSIPAWLRFKEQHSLLDDELADCPAQYASSNETPTISWDKCKTKLKELDTHKLHYVKVQDVKTNLIGIDFDKKGDDGKKSFERNLEAASKWPATYAELSKSGAGIHLHYIYDGDVSMLSRIYDADIEIKVFTGNSSLRRMLTKCNDIPIATINSGLPLKEEKNTVGKDKIKSERGLRQLIKRNLNKEIHPYTKPSICFIRQILDDAYNQGLHYDVSDMFDAVLAFAMSSTNNADFCIKQVKEMKFKSDEPSENTEDTEKPIAFYDIEIFPNLCLVNWKIAGEGNSMVRMINPKPIDIEKLITGYRLIGFNCRRYDNHILFAIMMGYDNEQLYRLSQRIINHDNNAFFGEAYNISYTDIYDFASSTNKKSLKKLEIEMSKVAHDPKSKISDELRKLLLRIKHQELGLEWDKPVPKELWVKVAEYCDNDVISTEAAFYYLKADWTARQILADLAEMTANDTTNTLTTRIIFGKNRKPQSEFMYRDLSQPVKELPPDVLLFLKDTCPEMMAAPHNPQHAEAPFKEDSLLPYFPGYTHEFGKSMYRGEDPKEGGFAQGLPGMYGNVALLDIASMHPHTIIAECLFGVKYTRAFRDIVEGRVSIKHKAWDEVDQMMDGKLRPYIEKVKNGELSHKDLANALKTAINSVYGLTAAGFDNAFRDNRNVDNIVAKRGALFMIDLKHAVMERGFKVAHIKTDSIKIPDATPEIIKFVMDFGKRYGYTFEHEATYEKMCLVNDAVYIAKYKSPEDCQKMYGYVPGDNAEHGGEWTATGKQFAVPYVFKTLFSHEPIVFDDMCETFSVSKGALYLDINEKLPDVSELEKQLDKLESDYKKGKISDIMFEPEAKKLAEDIEPGHNLQFVGRVGQFTPILAGENGGVLYRVDNGKNYAASGSTGYRWLESEMVRQLGKEDAVDKSFYRKQVDAAIAEISKYGDFEQFASDDPYVCTDPPMDFMYIPPGVTGDMPFKQSIA